MKDQYTESLLVKNLHKTPRFGHSNDISHLFSPHHEESIDYVRGILAFGVFLFFFYMVWLAVLVVLKHVLGGKRKNTVCQRKQQLETNNNDDKKHPRSKLILECWAAGGERILVNEIKKHRPDLKGNIQSIVRRSWRIQYCFVVCAIFILVGTILFLKQGLSPIVTAVEEIYTINQEIASVSDRGTDIVTSLLRERSYLNQLFNEGSLNVTQYCPTQEINRTIDISLVDAGTYVHDVVEQFNELVDTQIVYAQEGLTRVKIITVQVESFIDSVLANDWIPKLLLLALNVLNLALLCGVALSRSNVVFFPFKAMLVWFVLPLFIVLLTATTIGSSSFGMTMSLNADFCSGGSNQQHSPIGTIEDIILRQNIAKDDISYQAFDYYMNSCTTKNPFAFIAEYETPIRDTMAQANDFLQLISDVGLEAVTLECGSKDITPLLHGAQQLITSLQTILSDVESAMEIADCATISPILRGVIHGSTCNEAVHGLAYMFAATFLISVCGLIMITLRAALYNATIRAPKKSKKERTEREWKEYVKYMSQFYEDAPMWKLQPDGTKMGKTKDNIDKSKIHSDELDLAPAGSFETAITKTSTMEEEEDNFDDEEMGGGYGSDDAGVYLQEEEDGNAAYDIDDDDDYSSYYSSDSDSSMHVQFKTPRQEPSVLEQIRTSEKLRDISFVLDSELRPLSPQPTMIATSVLAVNDNEDEDDDDCTNDEYNKKKKQSIPKPPQKFMKHLRRTTQRKTLL